MSSSQKCINCSLLIVESELKIKFTPLSFEKFVVSYWSEDLIFVFSILNNNSTGAKVGEYGGSILHLALSSSNAI